MNLEVIMWTCITVAVIVAIGGIGVTIVSARNMKKRRQEMATIHTTLKAGVRVLFAGGIYGTITKVKDDIVDVEVSKGVVVSISRYSIQSIG